MEQMANRREALSGISLLMTTWAEREFLCKERQTAWPGFSPRAYHKLAVARPPCTDTKIKVRQKLRCSWEDTSRWHIWGYHTWLDVGRLPSLFPSRPDIPYDSNVWRWITASRTYCMPQPPVPPPSEMDGNTYLKFIAQGALFFDQKHKERAVAQIEKELQACKQLKMRSECRAPPLNSQGNILPPKDFNRCTYKTVLGAAGSSPWGLDFPPLSNRLVPSPLGFFTPSPPPSSVIFSAVYRPIFPAILSEAQF
uniref:Testis expressed 52 n=1 Tax=Pelusios castaneus TaxID=367368 RepID=A0A8C8S2Z3_9SAUR